MPKKLLIASLIIAVAFGVYFHFNHPNVNYLIADVLAAIIFALIANAMIWSLRIVSRIWRHRPLSSEEARAREIIRLREDLKGKIRRMTEAASRGADPTVARYQAEISEIESRLREMGA